MPGQHITDEQRRKFMKFIEEKHSVETAAAKSGFSQRTGFRIKKESRSAASTEEKKPRGRRRRDPLEGIWDSQVLPVLRNSPGIRPSAVFYELVRNNPELDPGIRRTLERRIRDWRAEFGPDKEVIFRQNKEAGHLGISDFTRMKDVEVTIGRKQFDHRLYHFRLPWSGFVYASVVEGGESFAAFAQGLQGALRVLGGAPAENRTDSLSAAFRNLRKDQKKDMTRRYEELCAHYGMEGTRNNKGIAHENGAIEGAHGHLKREIADALELRGSRDFVDIGEYRDFVAEVVSNINARRVERIEAERRTLRPLPSDSAPWYERHSVVVTSSGGFLLKGVFYTVPSRLIGHRLDARLYDSDIELHFGGRHQLTLPRRRKNGDGTIHCVNYHHVIHSLKKKPQALMNLVYRDELFPREEYKQCFEFALLRRGRREACRMAVKLLAMAHEQSCEEQLALAIRDSVNSGELPDIEKLKERFVMKAGPMRKVDVQVGNLSSYAPLFGFIEEKGGKQ